MPARGVRTRVPVPRRALVERARLLDRLGAGGSVRLVLVAAPAGFGKTTLLAQWLGPVSDRSPGLVVAWVPLTGRQRDVAAFLELLVVAVADSEDATPICGRTSALLSGERPVPAEDVLVSLVNELDEVEGRVVIALDDFHLAESSEVSAAVTFLLDNLPPHVTLAMTCRSDPALPLARLRGRGELLELRAADLRFNTDEAGRFLTGLMELPLTADQVAALETRTEGWAAGLQLAALSARARAAEAPASVDAFVNAFSGSHRFVLDYLVEEVLDAEDPSTCDFLLRTSVLDRMTGPLCDAVTGGVGGSGTLRTLERRNLFVVPLDDTRDWYRYHHLFAEALRARLTAHDPQEVARLHRAAAHWYAGSGMLEDALDHARHAAEEALVGELVEASLPRLRKERRDSTIIDRLALVPEAVALRRPLLAVFRAWSHMASGETERVEEWLDAAELVAGTTSELEVGLPEELARLHRAEVRIVPSTVAIYRASLAQAHGDRSTTIAQAERARDLADDGDHLIHAAAAGFLGLADWARGNLTSARQRFEETRTRLEAAGNVADALATTVPVADMAMSQGDLHQARQLFEHGLRSADATPRPLASHADLHVGLAAVLREQGDAIAAAGHLEQAHELGGLSGLPENRFRRHAVAGDLLRTAGDIDGALTEVERARSLYLPGFFPDIRPLAAHRARLLLTAGRVEEVRRWADERGFTPGDPADFAHEYELLTFARLLLAEGNPGPAVGLLDRLTDAAQEARRVAGVVEGLVLRALARRAVGDDDAARADLSGALELGVPAGFRRLFLDEGERFHELLEDLVAVVPEADAAHHHARLLLGDGTAEVVPLQLAAEPLSEREVEVLRMLATDLSGPEIAQTLFISLNTFRTHTKRIFTKLDVRTRRTAVSRASELDLL